MGPHLLAAGIGFGTGLTRAFSDLFSFLPRLLGFLLILGVGYLIAHVVTRGLVRLALRLGLDRSVAASGLDRSLHRSPEQTVRLAGQVLFLLLMIVVLQAAFGVFATNPISHLLAAVVAFLPKLVVGLLIVAVAVAIAGFVRAGVAHLLADVSYGSALATAAAGFVVYLGVTAALVQVDVAREIVLPLFYAVLVVAAGVAVVGLGGALIVPMQSRWDRALGRAGEESSRMRQAYRDAREREQEEREQAIQAAAVEAERRRVEEAERRQAEEDQARERAQAAQRAEAEQAEAERAQREAQELQWRAEQARAQQEAEDRAMREAQERAARQAGWGSDPAATAVLHPGESALAPERAQQDVAQQEAAQQDAMGWGAPEPAAQPLFPPPERFDAPQAGPGPAATPAGESTAGEHGAPERAQQGFRDPWEDPDPQADEHPTQVIFEPPPAWPGVQPPPV